MTVICWDGTTLAADKRATNNGVAHTVTKITRCGDVLLGVAGHFARGSQIMQWFTAGRDPATYPREESAEQWATLIVIHRDGTIHKYEASCGYPFVIEERRYAIGGARDFALMAMHLGYGAQKAVELTCALSVECGNGIDTLAFDRAEEQPHSTSGWSGFVSVLAGHGKQPDGGEPLRATLPPENEGIMIKRLA